MTVISRTLHAGVSPGLGGTQRLPRLIGLIGLARPKDLVDAGRFAGAEEDLRIGLVDQMVLDSDVYASAAARLAFCPEPYKFAPFVYECTS